MSIPMSTMSKVRVAVGAAAICAVAACATTTPPNAALDEARLEFAEARSAGTGERAPVAFQEAEKTLAKALDAYREGEDRGDVTHLARLAQRQVETARAEARAAQERAKLEQLDAARAEVLLDARTREVERLQRELNARTTERGIVVTLSDILFDVGSANLKPAAEITLQRVAEFLIMAPERAVEVAGHTDATGGAGYNELLSQRRAAVVAARLVALGVDPSRVRAVGFGEQLPVASNATAAGRQQNRRVELVIDDPPPAVSLR